MVLYISEAMKRSVSYKAASAIEEHRQIIGISLIAGSVGFWFMHLMSDKQQTYAVTLPPGSEESTESPQRQISFPKEDFKAGAIVEPTYAIETSRGDTLSFRPTQYPLTVETKMAGLSFNRSQIPVKVVEVWVNGEKQGYFDFHQDRFVAENMEKAEQQNIANISRDY
jgi:hypothetical protein